MIASSSEYSKHDHTTTVGSSGSYDQDAKVAECGVIIVALDDLNYAIEALDEALGNLIDKIRPALHDAYPQVTENKGEDDDASSDLYKDITVSANKIYRLRDFVVEIKERIEL